MRKLFIDCTFMSNTKIKTGVPRVVQNIVNNAVHLSGHYNLEMITVEIKGDALYEKYIDECNGSSQDKPKKSLIQKISYRFNRYFKKAIPTANDILLLIEHYDGIRHMEAIKRFKQEGGRVVYVIHDLIPIRHPEFCGIESVKNFTVWFQETLKYADGYISISKTVMEDVQSYISSNGFDKDRYFFDYFRLGSDNEQRNIEVLPVRHDLGNVFSTGSAVYLIVSTIEPRKNHQYLLGTFDRLWSKNMDVILLIVGQIGWQVEELIDRIRKHDLYGKKLMMFNDLDDQELAYCYRHAKALLFPSYTEGFGLPIVESLQAGLPVLASDTLIHREVGRTDVDYFDIFDPSSLAIRIESIEKGQTVLRDIRQNPVKVTSWEESTGELLSKIINHQV